METAQILSIVLPAIIVGFAVASMIYVYQLRGKLRFSGFGEYVRKGWPLFAPVNCLLYLSTRKRARRPIMDVTQFPELQSLQQNWQTIQAEAQALMQSEIFDQIRDPQKGAAYYDLGFRTFYKYGWSKFYLRWYGYTHASARQTCPQTCAILEQCSAVNGAMFSILPPGSKLTRHLDPLACSLRYHLGLDVPEDDACFIEIDGVSYSWRNGEALLFDETYLHHARNDTDRHRLILMCDVRRPMGVLGSISNFFFKQAMRLTVVPNTPDDRRGLVNRLFSTLSPTLGKVRSLKKTHRGLYLLIKHTVNALLVLIALALLAGLVYGVVWLFEGS